MDNRVASSNLWHRAPRNPCSLHRATPMSIMCASRAFRPNATRGGTVCVPGRDHHTWAPRRNAGNIKCRANSYVSLFQPRKTLTHPLSRAQHNEGTESGRSKCLMKRKPPSHDASGAVSLTSQRRYAMQRTLSSGGTAGCTRASCGAAHSSSRHRLTICSTPILFRSCRREAWSSGGGRLIARMARV
jgi:hypothetical protein